MNFKRICVGVCFHVGKRQQRIELFDDTQVKNTKFLKLDSKGDAII